MALRHLATMAGLVMISAAFGIVSPAHAFDSRRQGFVLELGLGAAVTKYDVPIDRDGTRFEDRRVLPAAASRFGVGAGLSNRIVLMYVNDVAWSLEDYSFYEDALVTTGLTGIGMRAFFDPRAPSWSLEAAAGLGVVSALGNRDSGTGFGFALGGGREFAPHWQVRLTITQVFADAPFHERTSVALSASWLRY